MERKQQKHHHLQMVATPCRSSQSISTNQRQCDSKGSDNSSDFDASVQETDVSGRERLKRHRREVAGWVVVADKWSQEEMLKDWLDSASFDALLAPNGFDLARAALVAESRQVQSLEPMSNAF